MLRFNLKLQIITVMTLWLRRTVFESCGSADCCWENVRDLIDCFSGLSREQQRAVNGLYPKCSADVSLLWLIYLEVFELLPGEVINQRKKRKRENTETHRRKKENPRQEDEENVFYFLTFFIILHFYYCYYYCYYCYYILNNVRVIMTFWTVS